MRNDMVERMSNYGIEFRFQDYKRWGYSVEEIAAILDGLASYKDLVRYILANTKD